MANILGFVGMVLCSVALVAGIVAVAINMWETAEFAGTSRKNGLWKSCVADTCVDINLDDFDSEWKSSVQALRALVIIGILVMAAAIACAVLWLFVMKENAMLILIGGVAAAIGGVMFLAAMAVFVAKVKTESFDLSAGFAIDIVGWILAWAGAGVLIFSKVKAE